MKKVLTVLAVILAFGINVSAFAKGSIFVDLQEVVSDTPPQIINGRTMVPVRAITEMLGYDVYWHEDARQVDICEKGSWIPVIIMHIDSTKAYYTRYDEQLGESVGVEEVLDSPATLINNRTFVPLRFISEAVNYDVEYIEDTKDVYLFSPEYIKTHQSEGKEQSGENGDNGVSEGLVLSQDSSDKITQSINIDQTVIDVPLTYEDMHYVSSRTTGDWMQMTETEKNTYVNLVIRWWKYCENRISEDYNDMVRVVDKHVEKKYKNTVDVYIFGEICLLYDVEIQPYMRQMYAAMY